MFVGLEEDFEMSGFTTAQTQVVIFINIIHYLVTLKYFNTRYFEIDQHLARHFFNNVGCLSSPLSMQSNNYPSCKFNDLHQSGNRVVILANFGTLYPYSSSSVEFILF